MPTPYIKKLSREGKGSVPELEKKWDDAKEAAGKQGHAKDYGYVTNIFKKMSHASLELQAKSRLLATEGHWEEGFGRIDYYDENGTMAAVIRVQQQGRKNVDVFEVDIPGKPKKYFGSMSTGATHQDLYDAKAYVVKECKGKGLVASHVQTTASAASDKIFELYISYEDPRQGGDLASARIKIDHCVDAEQAKRVFRKEKGHKYPKFKIIRCVEIGPPTKLNMSLIVASLSADLKNAITRIAIYNLKSPTPVSKVTELVMKDPRVKALMKGVDPDLVKTYVSKVWDDFESAVSN